MSHILAIPLRSFAKSKTRLADSHSDGSREDLSREIAEMVIAAGKNYSAFDDIVLITSDKAISLFAHEHDVSSFVTREPLNEALNSFALTVNNSALTICHADTAFIDFDPIMKLLDVSDVIIGSDRHLSGTNVLAIKNASDFVYHFGENSCSQHIHEAQKLGRSYVVTHPWRSSLDIDTVDDVKLYEDIKKSRTNPAL